MADYDKYMQLLGQDAASNVYSDLGGLSSNLGKSSLDYVKQPGADIGEAILYGSILGLLGGGLGEYGKQSAADETGLAAQILMGRSNQKPEGLSPSLYKNALTYRDLLAQDRLESMQEKADIEKLGIASQLVKDVNKKDVDLDYIAREKLAEEAAKRQSILGGKAAEGAAPAVGNQQELQSMVDELGYDLGTDVYKDMLKKKTGGWFEKIPSGDQTKIAQASSMTKLLNNLADQFESLNQSAVEFQPSKNISGTEANLAYSKMMALVPTTVRLMGDVGNLAEQEQRRIIEATIGNLTSGTGGVATRLRELAGTADMLTAGRLAAYKSAFESGGDSLTGSPTPNPVPTPISQAPQIGSVFNGERITNVRQIR